MATIEQIKQLRDKTGLSIALCRQALLDSGGDETKALEILKARASAVAAKKSSRALGAGVVSSYIHGTKKIGSLVELVCETDFVARHEDFSKLAYDLAMQVAATDPADTASLLAEPFIKNPEVIVEALIKSAVAKFGENIAISRFIRFAI